MGFALSIMVLAMMFQLGHGVWDQDYEVLRNTYRDLQKVNPGLKRNASLEKIVQSSETCNIYSRVAMICLSSPGIQ